MVYGQWYHGGSREKTGRRHTKGKSMSQKRRTQRGIALIWAALVILVMIGIVGLSLDWGKLALNVHQLHNAADAGALAGALIVKFTPPAQTRQMAITLAHENDAERLPVSVADNVPNDPNGEVVIGRWIRQMREFIPTLISPNAVKVRGNRPGQSGDPPLALLFGPVFNVQTVNASRYAIAMSIGSTGAGIICLAADPSSLPGWTSKGAGAVPVGGTIIDLSGIDPLTGAPIVGDWQVNATSDRDPWTSFRLDGTKATLNIGELNACGTTNPPADDAGAWETLYDPAGEAFSVNPYARPVGDPLLGLIPPDISTMPAGTDTTGKVYGVGNTISGGTLTLNPGYYPGGIQMSGGDITLNPGVYAFGGSTKKNNGPGFVIGGGTIRGDGVMLYITGDPDGAKTGVKTEYGRLDIGGNAELNAIRSRGDAMTPPQINGELGVAIWQDRANTSYARIIGGGNCRIIGTIYCGYNALEIGGNFDQMGNQVIAGALALNGTVDLGIAYDGRNQIRAFSSILVE